MEDLAGLRALADKSDEPTRRDLLQYVELRKRLAELTGDAIDEGTPMLAVLYEQHPKRREIVWTAERLQVLGHMIFPKLDR